MMKTTMTIGAILLLFTAPASAQDKSKGAASRLKVAIGYYFESAGKVTGLLCGREPSEQGFLAAAGTLKTDINAVWERHRERLQEWIEESRSRYERGIVSGRSFCGSGDEEKNRKSAYQSQRYHANAAKKFAAAMR